MASLTCLCLKILLIPVLTICSTSLSSTCHLPVIYLSFICHLPVVYQSASHPSIHQTNTIFSPHFDQKITILLEANKSICTLLHSKPTRSEDKHTDCRQSSACQLTPLFRHFFSLPIFHSSISQLFDSLFKTGFFSTLMS